MAAALARNRAVLPPTCAGGTDASICHGTRPTHICVGLWGPRSKGRSNISFALANRHRQQSGGRARGEGEGVCPLNRRGFKTLVQKMLKQNRGEKQDLRNDEKKPPPLRKRNLPVPRTALRSPPPGAPAPAGAPRMAAAARGGKRGHGGAVTARLVTAHATVSKGSSHSEFPLEAALPPAGKHPGHGGGFSGTLGTQASPQAHPAGRPAWVSN